MDITIGVFMTVFIGFVFILSIGAILLYEPPKKEAIRQIVMPTIYRTGDGDAAWKRHQMVQKALRRGRQ
ncbi:hypothetical protein L1N85_10755 [Paenibacillus alkaliterrae]|uniref:hypothetical protein n=1 Tax=Paenibacillus alkaliterrae TaxID=320909 RepID=UPI001F331FC1|nr:hypothetical protein [Paenibacillus alkaliterrae]MCF2938916.1 hypothetical protein [Paenibacillus alkaliterrae]